MRNVKPLTISVLVFILMTGMLAAQEDLVDRLNVKFSDPAQPGFVELELVNGGITVTGYNGDEVVIEARTRLKAIEQKESQKESEGMIRIPVTTTALTVEEDDNVMEIEVESWKRTIDMNLRVPYNTSLKLQCVHHGDIYVENVRGRIVAENVHGSVTLKDISGSAAVSAHHEGIKVNFREVSAGETMSFESYHGDVDITFPGNVKAAVQLKSENGGVYSDFQIEKSPDSKRVVTENGRSRSGKYRVRIEHAFFGTINGGGPDMKFDTYHGDIFIRRSK